jgi:hypothetical protein
MDKVQKRNDSDFDLDFETALYSVVFRFRETCYGNVFRSRHFNHVT